MIAKDFYIVISSLPDRENLVAEICYKGYQWVEISQELSDEMVVQFYSHPKQQYWEFPLEDALATLKQAKQMLLQKGSTKEVNKTLQFYDKAYIEACEARPNYILWVRFEDGLEGEIDLSERIGRGELKPLKVKEIWESIRIDPDSKTVCWGNEIVLNPVLIKQEILRSQHSSDPSDFT